MSGVVKGFWCAFVAILDTQALVCCVAINRGRFYLCIIGGGEAASVEAVRFLLLEDTASEFRLGNFCCEVWWRAHQPWRL